MANKRTDLQEIPAGFKLGKDIDLATWHRRMLAVDLSGRVYCFLGYRSDDQPEDILFYAPSVALRDKGGRNSHHFIELSGGALNRAFFFHENNYYRILDDCYLALPSGSNSYFGVVSSDTQKENIELTRSVFGGSMDEILSVASALASILGRKKHEALRLPRLTFSRTQDNRCDLSGCLIPKNFPYLAFEDPQYDWGHVSLYGFYRLLDLMCLGGSKNSVRKLTIESGVTEELLDALLRNSATSRYPILYPDHI